MSRSRARLAGEASIGGDVDEQPAARLGHRPRVVSCQKDRPSGFIASVIICWWPTET